MTPAEKRRGFQWVKTLTTERFWSFMNFLHGKAYGAAVRHYSEAAEVVLPPRYQKLLHDKAKEIREKWDGMNEITLDETERMDFERRGSR